MPAAVTSEANPPIADPQPPLIIGTWWLALAHLVSTVLLAVTIIGIPLAAGDLKLLPVWINRSASCTSTT